MKRQNHIFMTILQHNFLPNIIPRLRGPLHFQQKLCGTIFLILAPFFLSACLDDEGLTEPGGDDPRWLIPASKVFDGGPGQDGIPALANPEIIHASEATYLTDDDLVLGYAGSNIKPRAYPHAILDWHEIVNDDLGSLSMAVNYCPLTGTGMGWSRQTDAGEKTTFGVSGLLYNSNLILFDRATGSRWSQMLMLCVNGELIGQPADYIFLLETSWKTWKQMFPDSEVVSNNTGHQRPYGGYPYGDYRTNHSRLLFAIEPMDGRLPAKERVLGVVLGDISRAYRFNSFENGISVIQDEINQKPFVVVGSQEKNFLAAFVRQVSDGTILDLHAIQDELPAVMVDNEGTHWDALGRGISGPRVGQQLRPMTQFIGYWVAWAGFYPGLEIYSSEE